MLIRQSLFLSLAQLLTYSREPKRRITMGPERLVSDDDI